MMATVTADGRWDTSILVTLLDAAERKLEWTNFLRFLDTTPQRKTVYNLATWRTTQRLLLMRRMPTARREGVVISANEEEWHDTLAEEED